MQRLTYAFRFIKACFSLAFKNTRLRMPWLYLWMGAVSLLILWLIPLVVVITLIGLTPLGMALMGLVSIMLLFTLLVWGEITGLETCQAFASLIQAESEQPESATSSPDFAHWQDISLWFLTKPGLEVMHLFNQAFHRKKADHLAWLGGSYLILPLISIEGLSLSAAVERVKQLFRDHYLRFHPDLVAIRPVAGVVQWVLVLVGVILGSGIGLMIANPVSAGVLSKMLGVALGAACAGILVTVGIFFSSFMRACYYTTLYQWVLNVETARQTGDDSLAVPPAILSQVMRKTKLSKKER